MKKLGKKNKWKIVPQEESTLFAELKVHRITYNWSMEWREWINLNITMAQLTPKTFLGKIQIIW